MTSAPSREPSAATSPAARCSRPAQATARATEASASACPRPRRTGSLHSRTPATIGRNVRTIFANDLGCAATILQNNASRDAKAKRLSPNLPDKRTEAALATWREGVDPRGTLAEKYLRNRKLELGDDLAGEVLRWHPRICSVLALFRNIVTDEPQAISRTFLDREGRKIERKFLGPVAGAAVMMDANENVLGGLHIGEGVETCMAARQLGLRPTWALGSAGAVAAFPVLPGIEALNVIVDHDANGAGEKAAREVEARWLAAGREVNLIRSDTPGDLNDALKGGFQ